MIQGPGHGVDGVGEGERAEGGGTGGEGDGARGVESVHGDFAGAQAGQSGERDEVTEGFVGRDWGGEGESLEVDEGAQGKDGLRPVAECFRNDRMVMVIVLRSGACCRSLPKAGATSLECGASRASLRSGSAGQLYPQLVSMPQSVLMHPLTLP